MTTEVEKILFLYKLNGGKYLKLLFIAFAFFLGLFITFTANSAPFRNIEARIFFSANDGVHNFISLDDANKYFKDLETKNPGQDSFEWIGPVPSDYYGTINGMAGMYYISYKYRYGSDPNPWQSGAFQVFTNYECPAGYSGVMTNLDPTDQYVYCQSNLPIVEPSCVCNAPKVGKPIYPSTGFEQEDETDYIGGGDSLLKFSRIYRSDLHGWRTNYQIAGVDFSNINQSLVSQNDTWPTTACYVGIGVSTHLSYCFPYLNRNNGKMPTPSNDFMIVRGNGWPKNFGTVTDLSPVNNNNNDIVSRVYDPAGNVVGWTAFNSSENSFESFDLSGRITLLRKIGGRTLKFIYSDTSTPASTAPQLGLLIGVIDDYGRDLKFIYNGLGQMITMIDPTGSLYQYKYDESTSIVLNEKVRPGNMTSVTFPDGAKKTYWYNEQDKTDGNDLPFALTGIVDENGKRYATIMYDGTGMAVSTELSNGTQKYTVSYPNPGVKSTVIDPLGNSRTYNFATISGQISLTGEAQTYSGRTISNSLTYDSQGNVSSSIDFNGVTSTYTYDLTRNLETSRTEASGTPQARTTTTTWHSTYRLPLQIEEPKRVTTFAYDANGNLLSKSVQATTDATGSSGLSATTTGPIHTWNYTYTSLGQMLTATGPTKDVTSYSYDDHGNLTSVINAVGHVTSLSNYDANGRVGRVTDPNGLITDLTYTPRGWLSSRTVGGQVTNYSYDGVGQLTQVTFPDTSTINYVYDDAHRLTSVADSLGNSIAYTLDNIGNRTGETVVDPTGALARQTNRVYDALNRLQQQTGDVR